MTPKSSPLNVYGERTIGEMYDSLLGFEPYLKRLQRILRHCGFPINNCTEINRHKIRNVKVREVSNRITLDPFFQSFEQLVTISFNPSNLHKISKE